MKRGNNGHESSSQNQASLDKESFAVGYAVSSTQGFIHDFAGSIQIPAHVLASGLAKFLSSPGATSFQPFHHMSGMFREATPRHQTMEPMALAERPLRDQASLTNGNGHHRRTMSASAKKKIGAAQKKRWAKQKKSTGKKAIRENRKGGFWDAQIIAVMGNNSIPRRSIQNLLHDRIGGDKSVIYPSVGSAIKKGLLIPGDGGTFRLNEQKAAAASAA